MLVVRYIVQTLVDGFKVIRLLGVEVIRMRLKF